MIGLTKKKKNYWTDFDGLFFFTYKLHVFEVPGHIIFKIICAATSETCSLWYYLKTRLHITNICAYICWFPSSFKVTPHKTAGRVSSVTLDVITLTKARYRTVVLWKKEVYTVQKYSKSVQSNFQLVSISSNFDRNDSIKVFFDLKKSAANN